MCVGWNLVYYQCKKPQSRHKEAKVEELAITHNDKLNENGIETMEREI